jgi:hypothetical protein
LRTRCFCRLGICGPTEDSGSLQTSAGISNVNARIFFTSTYSDESATSTSNTLLTKMNHTFDCRSPSVWTGPMCLSCPWSTTSHNSCRVEFCCVSNTRQPAKVISATSFEFTVVLFLHRTYPHDSLLGTNIRDRAAGTRWLHRIHTLDDPDSSSADVVLLSSDNTTIRAHRCVLSS